MPKKLRSRVYKKLILNPILIKCPQHNKILYRDVNAARQAAKSYRKKWGSKMDIYGCRYYIGFHIGHPRAHKGRKAGKLKNAYPRIK